VAGIETIKISGVTDGMDNDYVAQGEGALKALQSHDLVVVHVEAPDEAGHSGSLEHKIEAIEKTDQEIVSRLRKYKLDKLCMLILPDHPTPIDIQTHTPERVPFLLAGEAFSANGGKRLTEAEAGSTNFSIENGYDIIKKLIKG
jgi:2,3-bisphosphoglycerate-independent phosphoglycerate mutase